MGASTAQKAPITKRGETGIIFDTESAVDIESLISRFAFGSAK